MRNFRVWLCALGLLVLIALSSPSPVSADEGFLFPYAEGTYTLTQECHPDAWGNYVGVASTCAIDFTANVCGAEARAPVTGDFYSYDDDGLGLGNTAGILDGERYRTFFLHGDFVPSSHLNQGEAFGNEASHGNSTGCHWHMTVFDKTLNQWVNPLTLEPVGEESNQMVQPVPQPSDQLIHTIQVRMKIEESIPTPQPTMATRQTGGRVEIPISRLIIIGLFIIGVIGVLVGEGNTAKLFGLTLVVMAVTGFFIVTINKPVPATATTTPTATPAPPQAEQIVIRVSLPDSPQTTSYAPPTSGECHIDPDWPIAIQQWCPWVTKYAIENGIEPDWVAAMMWQESRGNPSASSSAGAVGLIQVMPSNGYIGKNDAAGRAAYLNRFGSLFSSRPTVEQLLNPEFNLAYGVGYLGGLFYEYGSMWDALLHYGGPGYGDTYRGAVKSHYDCIVGNSTGSCTPGLILQGD